MNLTGIIAAVATGIGALTGSLQAKDPLIQHIHSRVLETIENSDNVPGLKSEEFNSIKLGIKDYWNHLVEKDVLEITATDKEIRPYFVALQGIVEHVLAEELNKSVKSLTGVIHTPMPATPLCTEGEVSPELVDPSMENDPQRLFTVKARTTIIRDYLYKGGELYIAYPQDGFSKRTEKQQQIYKNELEKFPVKLFDRPLNCESIDTDLIGAFHLFRNDDGKVFAFAIKMTQANNPQDQGHFGLWFGEVASTAVKERISKISDNVLNYSQEPIHLPL